MARSTTAQRSPPARGRARPARNTGRGGQPVRWWPYGVVLALVLLVAVALWLRAGSTGGRAGDAIGTLTTGDFHALAFSPDDPNVVFFGHHDGVLRSEDGGATWQPLVRRPGFDAMGLAVSRADGRTLYLAGHDVFQVSHDGGATWQPVAHNLPGTDIHALAMSPDDASRLTAFVVGHGVLQSGDGGRTWQRAPGELPRDITALASAGSASGNPETLYAGSARSGVLRSADGGRAWTSAGRGLPPGGVLALAVDPVARGTVYAGGESGLYKSTDGGESWSKPLPYPAGNAVAVAVSPARPGRLLAIAVQNRQGQVHRSDDGGQTWNVGR